MMFQVTVNGTVAEFDQYQAALNHIDAVMAQWNNFQPHAILYITIKKVPDDTDTISVSVGDDIDARAMFGG